MESLLSGLSQHGYSILFAVAFLEAIGLPIPASLAMLVAGGASAHGSLYFPLAAASALSAMLLGDMLLFLLGRRTGWWFLGLLCRLSMNPESCIPRSADSFHRRGRVLLLFAKFLPGINTMAPPLAGSMNMRFTQFLALDLAGASLYVGTYLAVGFLFSDAMGNLIGGYHAAGRVLSWAFAAALAIYLGFRIWTWLRAPALRPAPSASPAEAAQALSSEAAVIYDVRSHGYYDRNAMRVKGSQRLDPNSLDRSENGIPADKPVYLYCTCIGDATSARVANLLQDRGVHGVVIKGGLRAWKKAGLPLEPIPSEEIAELPVFD